MPPQSDNRSTAASNGFSNMEQSTMAASSDKVLGNYKLGKTLRAGNMGKVKLATHSVTEEKFAVKIIHRVYPASANGSSSTPEAIAKQASEDVTKEIRALREIALSKLLHHPYICGMREMIVRRHNYYMVFEYINGGQMLDYIINHGRLRERVARKFARQIGSALDYCHRNSVVHRDLMLENILISETGDIKIIDFGLSNLYDLTTHLSTFCGHLYYAAPELLHAKPYTGPKVDVWNFGVVLYILVCGKVPFDDQSISALYDKVKLGLVQYPSWLTAECNHLLSRMLVTDPAARAPLSEVLNHPWMRRGFPGPPDPHLVHREPLRADELDKQVIHRMKGFEFGSEDDIEQKLVRILQSDPYIRAVQAWERRRNGGPPGCGTGESVINPSPAISSDSSYKLDSPISHVVKQQPRRFSSFDFFRRRLFSPMSAFGSTRDRSLNSDSHLSTLSNGEANCEPVDPTQCFHPLISIYYLAREKLERERIYAADLTTTTTTKNSVFSSSHVQAAPLSVGNGPSTEGSMLTPMVIGAILVKKFRSLVLGRDGDGVVFDKTAKVLSGFDSSPRPLVDVENKSMFIEHVDEDNEKIIQISSSHQSPRRSRRTSTPLGRLHQCFDILRRRLRSRFTSSQV